jgi:predicted HTH domain antitoxin
MALTLTIPDEVLESLKIPKKQLEKELTKEVAFSLYERGLLSMGIARRFAHLSKWAFIEGLAERNIQRHYYQEEMDEDLAYAKRY